MPKYKVEIHVVLRAGILDTQGKAVETALHALGFAGVADVRVGKHFELIFEALDHRDAKRQAREMCDKTPTLYNPTMEDLSIISARKQR